ncbi:uncharacterized protein [Bemisia tabaci]|uniref:uncharacterized protein n=1 Tax=Bemisia tabaci TaxID=7038 RepID=UPI003B28C07A
MEFNSTVDKAIERLNVEPENLIIDEEEVYQQEILCREEATTPETLTFKQWGESILKSAKDAVEKESGNDDNNMYLPELPQCIIRLLETFPLWSNVLKPIFKYGTERASSAAVESLFGDIKTRLLKHVRNLPISADVFLMYHSPYIDADLKTISNKPESRLLDENAAEELDTDEEEDRVLDEVLHGNGSHDSCNLEGETEEMSTFDNETRNHEGGRNDRTEEVEANTSCPACSSGNFPSGGHKCIKCGKFVHIIFPDTCGAPLEGSEEGYGQPALCIGCKRRSEDAVHDETTGGNDAHEICNLEGETEERSTFDKEARNYEGERNDRTGQVEANTSCPACANGNFPTGGHECIKCGKFVHIIFPDTCGAPLEGSEEGYGQPALCVGCKRLNEHAKEPEFVQFAPGGNFSSVTERGSEDNWRGQDLPLKKRKRESYLTPNKEILNYNLVSKGKPTPIGILKNGNKATDLKPVAVGREKYQSSRTCAFDSVAQTLACAYCDSDLFRKFVITRPIDNLLWRIVKSMEASGVTRWTYYWRASLLSKVCKTQRLKSGITKIDAIVVAGGLCRRLFQDEPSIVESIECSMKLEETRKITIPVITVELDPGEKLDLSAALSDKLRTRSSPCNNPMGGTATHQVECKLSSNLIIFELQHKTNVAIAEGNSDYIETPEYQLKEIPDTLRWQDNVYHLRGAVCFSGASFTPIGHYKSYCRRIDGYWEIYDDLETQKFSCQPEAKVQCELIFYTI